MDYLASLVTKGRAIFARVPRWELLSFGIVLAVLGLYLVLFSPPSSFKSGTVVRISDGMTAPEIATRLSDAHVIRHPSLFREILRLTGQSGAVQIGSYKFVEPQSMLAVVYRLIIGDYGIPPVRLTFVEGTTVREAAELVGFSVPGISKDEFMDAARGEEGYLFPDTYFFQPYADARTIVSAMRANFNVKIRTVDLQGHSLSDVITLASIIEKEARTPEDRRLVSGILWNRLRLNMPLQVDAVFGYIFNRATYSPSPKDLRVDSPYNTYTHKGLPPGPICNPSLDSIEAAAHPTQSAYLYYLSGTDGTMHYSTTYQGQLANLRKYLQ